MNENSLLEISVSGYAERYNGLTRSCGLLQRPSLQASFKRPWFPDPVVEFHGSSRMIYLSFSAFVNWCHIYLCLSFHGFHCEKLSLMFLLSSTPVSHTNETLRSHWVTSNRKCRRVGGVRRLRAVFDCRNRCACLEHLMTSSRRFFLNRLLLPLLRILNIRTTLLIGCYLSTGLMNWFGTSTQITTYIT